MSEAQQPKLLSPTASPSILLGMTAVTGMVDAVSSLALGHVFTANMTGNVVFLGFAIGGGGFSASRKMVLTGGFNPKYRTRTSTDLIIDKSGRVVIPKPLREELHLEPGDARRSSYSRSSRRNSRTYSSFRCGS
jgi:hypothetical protein